MSKETAESKLLKLIEETDAKDKAANPAAAATPPAGAGASTTGPAPAPSAAKVFNSVSSVGVSSAGVPAFLKNFFSLFARRGGKATPSQGFGFKQANQLLFLLIIVIGVILVIDFLKGMKESQRKIAFNVKQMPFDPPKGAYSANEQYLPPPIDITEYTTAVSVRNLFRPFEKKAEEKKLVTPLENQKIKDKVTNFKLVGISWLNSPETATVMIEDKSTTVTHFLKTGEDLQGVKIDTIYADRVEMSFQGEKLTMNL